MKISVKIPFTGGCSCGAIRYECTAEPIMMFKCHCRDCQQGTGSGFAPGMLLPRAAFRLTRGQLRYHFTPSIRRDLELREANSKEGTRRGSEFWPAASMIQVGFSRRWIFSFRTLNRGIKWIRQFRNSSNTRQHQQRSKTVCKKLRHFSGSMITPRRR